MRIVKNSYICRVCWGRYVHGGSKKRGFLFLCLNEKRGLSKNTISILSMYSHVTLRYVGRFPYE